MPSPEPFFVTLERIDIDFGELPETLEAYEQALRLLAAGSKKETSLCIGRRVAPNDIASRWVIVSITPCGEGRKYILLSDGTATWFLKREKRVITPRYILLIWESGLLRAVPAIAMTDSNPEAEGANLLNEETSSLRAAAALDALLPLA